MNKKYTSLALALAIAGVTTTAIPALADTNTPNTPPATWNASSRMTGGTQGGMRQGMKPAVIGTVSAISGNTITLTGRQGLGRGTMGKENNPNPGNNAPVTATVATTIYTVDATNAVVMKNNATSTVSSIAVGDTLMVQGTVSGTNITATMIRDGIMRPGNKIGQGKIGTSTPPAFQGNGQPIVAGKISAINGATLTITNSSNLTYSVDTTNAKITQGPNTVTLANVAVGDQVVVQGTINGTTVTATAVIDQKAPSTSTTPPSQHKGFFGSIGGFFMHMFGF